MTAFSVCNLKVCWRVSAQSDQRLLPQPQTGSRYVVANVSNGNHTGNEVPVVPVLLVVRTSLSLNLNMVSDCGCGAAEDRASLRRRVVLAVVHRPDDDDLLEALGGRGRWPQLLHQSMEGV